MTSRPRTAPPPSPMLSPQNWPRELLSLYSAGTLEGFVEEAFEILPRVVPADFILAQYLGTEEGLVRQRDSRGHSWSGTFMRRATELRIAPSVLTPVVASRFVLPSSEDDVARTAFYQQIMAPQGWRHAAGLLFGDPERIRLSLMLCRAPGQSDFSDEEIARLESLHPFLAPVVARFFEISTWATISEGIALALRREHRPFLVVDGQLRVIYANVGGRRACAEWNAVLNQPLPHARDGAGALTLPHELAQACQQLGEALQSRLRTNPSGLARCARHVKSPDHSVDASIIAVCQPTSIPTPAFMIEFRRAVRAQPAPRKHRLLARLTSSERDVAILIADGLTNQEVAERLGKSVHAVKFLLHQIYQKAGVTTRTRLTLLLPRSHAGATPRRRS